jgi:hypothetical protein
MQPAIIFQAPARCCQDAIDGECGGLGGSLNIRSAFDSAWASDGRKRLVSTDHLQKRCMTWQRLDNGTFSKGQKCYREDA